MKRLKSILIVFTLVMAQLFIAGGTAKAQDTENFYFDSFSAEYYLDQDTGRVATLAVQETLVAVFPEFDQNHGIERALHTTYEDKELGIKLISVKQADGSNWDYSTYSDVSGNLAVRIGDADKYVHGEQTYIINYTYKNVMEFTDEFDEFYWDINGDDWLQSFNKVSASITVAPDLSSSLKSGEYCYAGGFGANNKTCNISRENSESGVTITASSDNLTAYETLTISIAFDKNTFQIDPWPARRDLINSAVLLGLPLATVIWSIWRWFKHGKDPRGRGVVPQYVPLENFSAMKAKALIDERFKASSISAGILELATNGYLKIIETAKGKKSDYEVELIKSPRGLAEEQLILINGLFGGEEVGAKKNLSTSQYTLASTARSLSARLTKTLAQEGYFKETPAKSITKQLLLGMGLFAVGIAIVSIKPHAWGLGVGLILSGIPVMAMSWFMPVKTAKGVEAKEYILGLKDYIKLAEKDRIEFLQSPEGVKQYGDPAQISSKLHLFEKLLPFAMIFGMEKDWAKQFQHLYQQAPDWYSGTRPFVATSFAHSIAGVSSTTTKAFSAPSSSGGSGFGGGGSSGGGGGGGGGGGW